MFHTNLSGMLKKQNIQFTSASTCTSVVFVITTQRII